jgi:hypothetical protein
MDSLHTLVPPRTQFVDLCTVMVPQSTCVITELSLTCRVCLTERLYLSNSLGQPYDGELAGPPTSHVAVVSIRKMTDNMTGGLRETSIIGCMTEVMGWFAPLGSGRALAVLVKASGLYL